MKCAAAVLFLLAASASAAGQSAAIRGVAVNGSTSKPQAGVKIALLKLEQGMIEIGKATTGADGSFQIEAPPPSGEIPYLVRAEYQNVAYHAAARDVNKPVAITIYEKTSDHAAVKLVSEQLIIEPREGRMLVADIFTVRNETSPPKTLAASGGEKDTFRFTVAKGLVQDMGISVSGPSQMPLRQTASEHPNGVYGLEYPFRPGETKIEINYRLPYSTSANFEKLPVKPLIAGAPEITVIAPLDAVKLESPNLTVAKQEASQGAVFYAWNSTAPVKFDISGALPEAGPETGQDTGGGSGRQVSGAASAEDVSTMENQNFIFQARWKILIVLAAALILGLAHLYRNASRSSS